MKISKSFLITIVSFAAVLLAMVIFKASSHNRFRNDASKWAKSSINYTNLITHAEIEEMNDNAMLISLNPAPDKALQTAIYISPEEVMNKDNIRRIRKHDGPKILVADDSETAARIWMLLSQTGISELYILKD